MGPLSNFSRRFTRHTTHIWAKTHNNQPHMWNMWWVSSPLCRLLPGWAYLWRQTRNYWQQSLSTGMIFFTICKKKYTNQNTNWWRESSSFWGMHNQKEILLDVAKKNTTITESFYNVKIIFRRRRKIALQQKHATNKKYWTAKNKSNNQPLCGGEHSLS